MPLWGAKNGPASRLDKLLEDAEISSAQIARELSVDPSTITKYRKGSRIPDADALAYMVKRAGASADEVLGLKPAGSVTSRAALQRQLVAIASAIEQLSSSLPDED